MAGKVPSQSSVSKTAVKLESKTSSELEKVLFNLRIDLSQRLALNDPPGCIETWPSCSNKHFRHPLIAETQRGNVKSLQAALQSDCYALFLQQINGAIQRTEWPTDSILNQIIEHILKINPGDDLEVDYAHVYLDLGEVFMKIVERFPPCWLAVRPSYYDFFKSPIVAVSTDSKSLTRKCGMVVDWLELLEVTLNITDDQNLSSDLLNKASSLDKFFQGSQAFGALQRKTALERLFLVLQLLLNILERDLTTWVMYTATAKTPSKFFFEGEHKPLVAAAFGLTAERPNTATICKTFQLFVKMFDSGVDKCYLNLMVRLISLVMLAVKISNMETLTPHLDVNTKNLICDFFYIFKEHHGSNMSKYDVVSRMLHISFVRYEFLHNVLKISNFSPKGDFSPFKIFDEILMKQSWLKLKPQEDLADRTDVLSRELYLRMVLLGLKDYCTFYGLKPYYVCQKHGSIINRVKQFGSESYDRVTLGDIDDQYGIDGNVAMQPNKENFLEMKLAHLTNTALKKYEEDLQYIAILHEKIPELFPDHIDYNFKDWLEFFDNFFLVS